MKLSVAGWLIFAVGVIVAAGEFVLALVFSGTTIAEGPAYLDGQTVPAIIANVKPEDKPVRILLTAKGVMRGFVRTSRDNSIALKLDFGDGQPPLEHISRPRDRPSAGRPNVFNTTFPVDLGDRQPGTWRLSLDVDAGKTVELEQIDLKVRASVTFAQHDADYHRGYHRSFRVRYRDTRAPIAGLSSHRCDLPRQAIVPCSFQRNQIGKDSRK